MSTKPPSGTFPAWTPFFRRFINERAANTEETVTLQRRVTAAWRRSMWAQPNALSAASNHIFDKLDGLFPIPDFFRPAVREVIANTLRLETHIFGSAENASAESLKDQVQLRRFLRMQQEFLDNEEHHVDLIVEVITASLAHVIQALPNIDGNGSIMTAPLVDMLSTSTADIVERINSTLFSEDLIDANLFNRLREIIYVNCCRASRIPPFEETKKELVPPTKSGLTGMDLITTYHYNTPWADLFDVHQVPFKIPKKALSEHGFIIAKPGHGKTQLLGTFVAQFLQDPAQPGLFILDPAGDWFEVIRDRVDPKRLVVLDPETNPPKLNFFDFRNSTDTEALQSFIYLMSSLSGGLSEKQGAIAPYLLKLLRQIQGANLETLGIIVDEKIKTPDKSQFASDISRLPPVDQGFFRNQFYNASMAPTKEAISWKIYGAIASDAFRKMFGASENSFDARAAMRDRKVVLARGSETTLGEYGLPIFMQYVVSQVFLAALARFRIPKEQRHQSYLLCDEASHIFNHQTTRILTECRKLGLSFIAATQLIEQIPKEVKAAIYGATSFKFAGEVSHTDAGTMANEMHCDADFIQNMQSRPPHHVEWAAYVSNMTRTALKVTMPMLVLENMPKRAGPPFAANGPATTTPDQPSPEGLGADAYNLAQTQEHSSKPVSSRRADTTAARSSAPSQESAGDDLEHIRPVRE